ncbi:hypothetical protein BZG36_05668, partial [Bifiguratus adelaidae]
MSTTTTTDKDHGNTTEQSNIGNTTSVGLKSSSQTAPGPGDQAAHAAHAAHATEEAAGADEHKGGSASPKESKSSEPEPTVQQGSDDPKVREAIARGEEGEGYDDPQVIKPIVRQEKGSGRVDKIVGKIESIFGKKTKGNARHELGREKIENAKLIEKEGKLSRSAVHEVATAGEINEATRKQHLGLDPDYGGNLTELAFKSEKQKKKNKEQEEKIENIPSTGAPGGKSHDKKDEDKEQEEQKMEAPAHKDNNAAAASATTVGAAGAAAGAAADRAMDNSPSSTAANKHVPAPTADKTSAAPAVNNPMGGSSTTAEDTVPKDQNPMNTNYTLANQEGRSQEGPASTFGSNDTKALAGDSGAGTASIDDSIKGLNLNKDSTTAPGAYPESSPADPNSLASTLEPATQVEGSNATNVVTGLLNTVTSKIAETTGYDLTDKKAATE